MKYEEFLLQKHQLSGDFGFSPLFMPDYLFDFQKHLVEWLTMKGRAACFADTGLGKTIIQLVWAENIIRKTNGKILLLTPLAVGYQTLKEAEKFGIEATRSRDGKAKENITITNYQQLEKFDPDDFVGIICDESSAIKDSTSQTRKNITRFSNKMRYRCFLTATPSPNDFIELGTTSEALGNLQYMDMLSQFFRDTSNDKNPQWSTPKYELKKHAINDFWKWVSSWARAIKKPSDLGFRDDGYILPKMIEKEHILDITKPLEGHLFPQKAVGLREQKEERKKTISERAEKVVDLCNHHETSVIWGYYNYETDILEKEISGAVQISGADSDESKEEKFKAFSDGEIKKLVTKTKIGAWGLNWQHCNHSVFFPSHSYEQYYQAVRRFYRFGQKRNVFIDIVTTEGEGNVMSNIKRKALQAEEMFSKLVKYMNESYSIKKKEEIKKQMEVPSWV
jgi:SNF2 family DNA or RNA helicase